jgi:hypothetical protein
MKDNKLNIYQKIHNVMSKIGTIQKRGYNNFHKYKYATEADYVEALRPLLEENGLAIIPHLVDSPIVTSDEDGNHLTSLKMGFTLVNIDKPEEKVTSIIPSQGTDKGDKGVYKALTGAKKYWAALMFMVETGDDPEQDTNSFKKSSNKKSKRYSTDDEF